MNTAIWVCQWVLALLVFGAALNKLIQPHDKLVASMKWARNFDARQIKSIAVIEVLAALGLVLPGLLNILPVLTPIAALCLVPLMAGATRAHIKVGENPAPALVTLALAAFVALGRFVLVPWV